MLLRFLSVLAITIVVYAAIPVVYDPVFILLLPVNHRESAPLPTKQAGRGGNCSMDDEAFLFNETPP